MYRQYEDPRKLEEQLKEWKQRRKDYLESKNNLTGELTDELIMIEDNISELEQRVNFAWQDEEFG